MTPSSRQALEAAVVAARDLAAMLGSSTIGKIAVALVENDHSTPSREALLTFGVPEMSVGIVAAKLRSVGREEARAALAASLLTISILPPAPEVEICWTGPSVGLPLRATGPVLEQIICAAKARIVMAEYDVTEGALPILRILKERSLAGVDVHVLVDRAEDKPALLEWARGAPEVEVWSRTRIATDPLSKFHLKIVLVDGCVGMFGSANLTRYGLRGNVEMGILVRDATAVSRAEESLLRFRKWMTRVSPASIG